MQGDGSLEGEICLEGGDDISFIAPISHFFNSLLDVNFQEVVHSVRAGNADVARRKRFAEDRMDTHKNARLTPKGREQMVRAVVDGGLSNAAAARHYHTSPKTVAKWVERFRADGVDGLRDRSSRPLSSPGQTPLATCATGETTARTGLASSKPKLARHDEAIRVRVAAGGTAGLACVRYAPGDGRLAGVVIPGKS